MRRPALFCLLGLLITAGYVGAGLVVQARASGDAPMIWSQFDEVNAHLPEIRRLMAGGNLAGPPDSNLAMVPGLHWLYAQLLAGSAPPQSDAVPLAMRLGNLLLAPLLALCGAGWLRALAPAAPPWVPALAFVLLLFSPYTLASGLYVTTDNVGMALFFACGWAVTLPGARQRIAAAMLLPTAVVLVRHIYAPALLALPLWSWISRPLRVDAIIVAFATVLSFAPFYIAWVGLTPPNFAAVHRTGLYLSNALAMCVFTVYVFVFVAPMLDPGRVRDFVRQPDFRRVVATGAVLGLALCALAPTGFVFDPSRWQDGSLLHLLDRKLAPLGAPWFLASRGLVVTGAIVLAVLAWIAWRDRERRYAAGLIALHLAALCLQERPYQRYFEAPLLLLTLMVLAPWLRSRAVFALPLVSIWLLQAAVYLERLF